MKKIVLVFGSIIGVILSINGVILVNMMYNNPTFQGNQLVGYAIMVLMFSLIFFGVRNYRDKVLDQSISFGNALKTGALIALVASTIYAVVWLICYHLFVPDFIDVYTEHVLASTAPEDVEAKSAQMADFKEMYQNPVFTLLITYSEVLPVGLVVALVSALVLKRS